MIKQYEFTRYYGYLKPSAEKDARFEVHVVCPPRCSIYEYIGDKNAPLAKMLCVDDYFLGAIPNLEIDFHLIKDKYYG